MLIVCLLFASGCASARQRPLFTVAPKEWNLPVKPFQIVGNVYYVGSSGISSYLVVSPDGLILLNCGTIETARQVLANIKQLGFDPGKVKILIGLHGHYDHVGGAGLIKQATGAKLFVGTDDRELVENGGRNDAQFGDAYVFPPVAVDRKLQDGEKIQLGAVELFIHTTPGHTPGTITCTMTMGAGNRQYHIVFAGSVTCPSYTLVGNPRYPEVVEDFSRTFKTLNSLPCDVFLTEHGWDCDLANKIKQLDHAGPNPFSDPAGYHQLLANAEARFNELRRKQSAEPQVTQ